jgi:hypothetical protein
MSVSYYILQSTGTSSSCSRVLWSDGKRQLFIAAEGSLEGWGIVSETFSEEFLDSLGRLPVHFGDHVLADVVQSVFEECLARSGADYPLWSSLQYVAGYLDHTTLRFSWIGDMYLVAWDRQQTRLVNRPHILTGIGQNGEVRSVFRLLQLRTSTPDEGLPEVGELTHVEHPMVVFLGNRNPALFLPHSGNFHELLAKLDPEEFQVHCRKLDTALAGSGVRGIFLSL